MAATYHLDLKVAARTAIRTLLETKTAPMKFVIVNSTGQTLAELPLLTPCCTVSGTTGQLTFNMGASATALDGGVTNRTAVSAILRDSGGSPGNWITADCQAGTAAVAGYFVLTTLDLVVGAPVQVVSATVG